MLRSGLGTLRRRAVAIARVGALDDAVCCAGAAARPAGVVLPARSMAMWRPGAKEERPQEQPKLTSPARLRMRQAIATTNPYYPTAAYDADYRTDITNPAEHTYADVGKYYALGATSEEVSTLIPEGFGRLQREFDATGLHHLQVKPVGVLLARHLEHWKQVRGRELAAQGLPVLDISPGSGYTPTPLALPVPRPHAEKQILPALTSRLDNAAEAAKAYISGLGLSPEHGEGYTAWASRVRAAHRKAAMRATQQAREVAKADAAAPAAAGRAVTAADRKVAAAKAALAAVQGATAPAATPEAVKAATDAVATAEGAAAEARKALEAATAAAAAAAGRVPLTFYRMRRAATAAGTEEHAAAAAAIHPSDPFEAPFHPLRVLTGPAGVGKSAILAYLVSYARKNGWLTIFVPDSWSIMNDAVVLEPSKLRPGFVDMHDVALRILQKTLANQSGILAKLPQRGTYAKYRYLPKALDAVVSAERAKQKKAEDNEKARLRAEAAARGEKWDETTYKSKVSDESDTAVDRSSFTMRDLVEWGIAHPSQATETLLALLEEARKVTEYPVMVAIDGINLLYEKTEYPLKGEGRDLWPEELSIPAALHVVGPEGFRKDKTMARGVYVTTVTHKHGRKLRMFEVADVKDKYRVRVPEMTRREMHATLLHYANTGNFYYLDDPASVDSLAVEYYRALCGGLPSEVLQTAAFQV